jgi:hypothetical protein
MKFLKWMVWYEVKNILTAGRKCDVRMNMKLNEEEKGRHENCTEGRSETYSAPPITLTLLVPQFQWPELFTAEKIGHF